MGNISVKYENYVAHVVMNRPPANALAQSVLREFAEVFHHLESNENVRAILLYGEGRFFSAGADIKEFVQIKQQGTLNELANIGQDVFETIESFPKPVIAAIHGAALGGGLELAMACHIRLVAENAKLGLPELQLGLVPGFGGTQRLPRYVGRAKAFEMLFTSDPILGSEAVKTGLANHAYPEEDLLNQAKALAEKIVLKSPLAIKAAIELVNVSKTAAFYDGIQKEAQAFHELFQSKDAGEGIQAFIEKRKPQFKGE